MLQVTTHAKNNATVALCCQVNICYGLVGIAYGLQHCANFAYLVLMHECPPSNTTQKSCTNVSAFINTSCISAVPLCRNMLHCCVRKIRKRHRTWSTEYFPNATELYSGIHVHLLHQTTRESQNYSKVDTQKEDAFANNCCRLASQL